MKRNGMCPLCFLKKILVRPIRVKDIYSDNPYLNEAAKTPPMGWSSWNTFRNNIDQEVIYDIALAMKNTGLRDAGYLYVNIDDNWVSSKRDEKGNLVGDLVRFADGIPSLVSKINKLGLKVGIYSSNGTLTCEDLPASLYNEKRDAETFASWGIEYFKYDFCHNESISKYAPLIYGITLSKVGQREAKEYFTKDAMLKGYAKILKNSDVPSGVMVTGLDENAGIIEFSNIEADSEGEYVLTIEIVKKGKFKKFLVAEINDTEEYHIYFPEQKIWNHTARFQTTVYLKKGINTIKFYNPIRNNIDSAILQYRYMGKCLLDAANKRALSQGEYKPITFSICEWGFRKPWLWGNSAGNLWRTTPDIRPIWSWIMTIYERNVKLYQYAGKGGWNDPDMLEVGNGKLTKDENIAHFATWCMMNAPLILGNDLRIITKDILDIVTNKDLIEINQDSLGKQAKRIKRGMLDILIKPLENNRVAVCFLNKFGMQKKVSVNIKSILSDPYVKEVNLSEETSIYDVIEKKESYGTKLTCAVNKHSAKVFILGKHWQDS